jgi:segregation and condensation protein B
MTRAEIEQLRGVDTGGVLDTLVERSLVKIAGRKDAPGRPIIYATTEDFLELFGLKDLESLPDLQEFRELEVVYQPENQPPADGEVTEQAPSVSVESETADESSAVTSGADTPSDEAGQNAELLVATAPQEEESAVESVDRPGPPAKKDSR